MDSRSSLLLLVAAITNCFPLFFSPSYWFGSVYFFSQSPAKVEMPYIIEQQRVKTVCPLGEISSLEVSLILSLAVHPSLLTSGRYSLRFLVGSSAALARLPDTLGLRSEIFWASWPGHPMCRNKEGQKASNHDPSWGLTVCFMYKTNFYPFQTPLNMSVVSVLPEDIP